MALQPLSIRGWKQLSAYISMMSKAINWTMMKVVLSCLYFLDK